MPEKLEIKYIPLSALTKQLWKRNPKKSDLGALHESINRYGFKTAPRFEPELNGGAGGINVGNHRLIALEQMKADGKEPPRGIVAENGEWLVPVQFGVDALTETESEAFGLDDNSLGMLGGDFDMYDIAKMYDEGYTELLKSLCDMDLPPVSMDHDDISAFLQTVENGSGATAAEDEHAGELVDKAEELNKKWQVKLGDLWECGDHRIICGDCTEADVVTKLLGDDKPNLMVTDPPYGVEYDANWRNTTKGLWTSGRPVANGKVKNDERSDWREAWALFEGAIAYVWHAGRHAKQVQESLEICGFIIRNQIIWAKSRFIISRGDYHWQHEPCWYAIRKNRKSDRNDDRSQSTLWQIAHNASETGHSTQKPLECMARSIRNHGKVSDLVYDPFLGSGTTMVACENLKRKCRAIELNPAYVAVALQRWSDLTGQKPKLIL